MSVYIDPMMPCVPNARWRWPESCHMFADGEEELRAFANRIGLTRAWFQEAPGRLPHYDLTRGMRARAVAYGALEVEADVAVEHVRRARTEAKEISP